MLSVLLPAVLKRAARRRVGTVVGRHGFKGCAPSKRGAFKAGCERHDAGAIKGGSAASVVRAATDAQGPRIVSEAPEGRGAANRCFDAWNPRSCELSIDIHKDTSFVD